VTVAQRPQHRDEGVEKGVRRRPRSAELPRRHPPPEPLGECGIDEVEAAIEFRQEAFVDDEGAYANPPAPG